MNARTGEQVAALPHERPARYAAFSRNGNLLLTASDMQLAVWDLGAMRFLISLHTPDRRVIHSRAVDHAKFRHRGVRHATCVPDEALPSNVPGMP